MKFWRTTASTCGIVNSPAGHARWVYSDSFSLKGYPSGICTGLRFQRNHTTTTFFSHQNYRRTRERNRRFLRRYEYSLTPSLSATLHRHCCPPTMLLQGSYRQCSAADSTSGDPERLTSEPSHTHPHRSHTRLAPTIKQTLFSPCPLGGFQCPVEFLLSIAPVICYLHRA